MERKRFTEEQIIGALKQHADGAGMPELARQHGVAEQTLYRWKAKDGNMEVNEARRLRELEAENAKLKRLLVDAMLDQVTCRFSSDQSLLENSSGECD